MSKGRNLPATTFSPVHRPCEPQCTALQTNGETDGRMDGSMMTIADHTAWSSIYDRLKTIPTRNALGETPDAGSSEGCENHAQCQVAASVSPHPCSMKLRRRFSTRCGCSIALRQNVLTSAGRVCRQNDISLMLCDLLHHPTWRVICQIFSLPLYVCF